MTFTPIYGVAAHVMSSRLLEGDDGAETVDTEFAGGAIKIV